MYRFIGRLFIVFGCIIFFSFLFLAGIEWQDHPDKHISLFQKVTFILEMGFAVGTPPMIVALSFFLFVNSMRRLLAGCFATIAFIAFHFYTAVCMAHGSSSIYIPLAVVEFTLSIWVARYGYVKSDKKLVCQ